MPTNINEIRERAASWSAPISAEAPTGTSAKQLPTYEWVIQEVAKLASPAEAASVDWARIVESGREILQKKSKDLPIASYLAIGCYATAGAGGLLEGTLGLGDLMEKYWATLFPEPARLRARANALNWFVERASAVLANPSKIAIDRDLAVALQQAAERLSQLSREKLANDSPGFGPVLKALEQIVLSGAPSAPPVEAAAAPSTTAAQPASPPAAAGPELSDPANATGYLREMGSALISSAHRMRQAKPTDSAAYRILRAGLWLHLEAPPPVGPDGKTAIPPLPAAKRAQLQTLETNAKWPELLEESEGALSTNRFNLDLHRIGSQALEMLGPPYLAAREAAIAELSAWLRRAPMATGLIANDGSPMADADTKKWIEKEVRGAAVSSGSEPPESAAAPAQGDDDQKLFDEARKLAKAKKYAEAIRLVEARIDASPSGRAKFTLRLFLAKLCADSGLSGAAKALYQSLDQQALQHDLDLWDPALAATCLEGLLKTARGERGPLPPEFAPQLQRLCRLSPAAALSANGLLATR
jgi:type VI secretion system protein VasJ